MKPLKALTLSLGEFDSPVITRYDLGLRIHRLYKEKSYEDKSISLQKPNAERQDFNKYLRQLLNDGVLRESRQLPKGVYAILGTTKIDPITAACSIDPFCYLSHLSALSFHGLTNRIPSRLYLSSPSPTDWKMYAQKRMEKDLKEDLGIYLDNENPQLVRIKMVKIERTTVHVHYSKHGGAYINVRDSGIRAATIGRTFLEAIRNPPLCGGINHVLEIFSNHAQTYLRLITNEIDLHGTNIDKVRVGYILEDRLGIKNEVIESWAQYAQRGGSRKLDASAEYKPVWSDKWCISINTFEDS